MASFERKNLEDGTPNPKYVDVLDQDEKIAGQGFCCISFLSPDKILEKRELFLFDQFVQQYDFIKSMNKFGDFINYLSYKYGLNSEKVFDDYNEFCKEEQDRLKSESVSDDFQNFLDKNEDKLTEQFQREHAFQTSVRGLKTRGNFSTQEEAEFHCKKLRERDPNHDIFVAPVGVWLPWDPNAYKTGRVEFMEEELNKLHQEKIKNEKKAKEEAERAEREAERKKREEDIIRAGVEIIFVMCTRSIRSGDVAGVVSIQIEDEAKKVDNNRKIIREMLSQDVLRANTDAEKIMNAAMEKIYSDGEVVEEAVRKINIIFSDNCESTRELQGEAISTPNLKGRGEKIATSLVDTGLSKWIQNQKADVRVVLLAQTKKGKNDIPGVFTEGITEKIEEEESDFGSKDDWEVEALEKVQALTPVQIVHKGTGNAAVNAMLTRCIGALQGFDRHIDHFSPHSMELFRLVRSFAV